MFTSKLFRKSHRIGAHSEHAVSYFIAFFLLFGLLMSPLRSANAAANCYAQHQIKAGETLSIIGRIYGISWTTIAQANNLANPNHVYVGQILCIPGSDSQNPPPATCQAQHVVQRGETLYRISLRYGISWTAIAQANNISNANRIYVGQTLCIPSGGTTPPPPANNGSPSFSIVSVVPNQSVTIRTSNFPANQQFNVSMGAFGTKGVNGTYVTGMQSGSGGSFTATYQIPANLRGFDRIAIRLQSPAGYYSYNWFYN
jgi:LysM repeat protein